MWSYLIVVSAPILQLLPSIFKAHEPVCVQTFSTEPAVKGFNEGVVRRFARTAEVAEMTPFQLRPMPLCLRLR
jgi:hypothetical protein